MIKNTKEIISEVNQYIENVGFNDSVTKLKNKDDKILYYYNYMDNISNRFCGKIEFPNLYHLKLANMLCNTDEKYDYFMDTYCDKNNIIVSIENFKKYIKEQRTYEEDIVKNIEIAVHNKDYVLAWSLIQELYLEPLDEYFLNKFINMVDNGLTIDDIYAWYKSKKRFLSMLTFNIEYIKSIREI